MSQAQLPNELATFLENWTTDPNNAKDAFVRFKDFLLTTQVGGQAVLGRQSP